MEIFLMSADSKEIYSIANVVVETLSKSLFVCV